MFREQIRRAIEIMKNRDCGDNFTIIEKSDSEVKVEINWSLGNTEILVIKII